MDFNEMDVVFCVVTDNCGNVYVLDGDTGYPLAGPVEVDWSQDTGESENAATNRAIRAAMEQAMEAADNLPTEDWLSRHPG